MQKKFFEMELLNLSYNRNNKLLSAHKAHRFIICIILVINRIYVNFILIFKWQYNAWQYFSRHI